MGLIVDTSVLIGAERGGLDLERLLMEQERADVWIAATTVSELMHGVERARSEAVREKRLAFVDWVVSAFGLATFGLEEARTMGRLAARMSSVGMHAGIADLQIAATAVTHGHAVSTLNTSEFGRIPEVRLLDMKPFVT